MNLTEALSGAQDLPLEAMQMAARNPDRIAGGVLRVVEKAASGAGLSEREQNLLFWGVHVLAQVRDTRLFVPLLGLLRRPEEEIDLALGDGVTGTLPRIVASVFDGDAAALQAVIADRETNEYVRWSLFGALAFLTFDGRIDRDATHAFLVRFDDERLARSGEAAWNGWTDAIALLGFADLAPRAEAAWAEARVLEDVSNPDLFRGVLAVSLDDPADPDRFAIHELGYVEDAVAELDALFGAGEDEDEPEPPIHNPLRTIGRNDPCPCGSDKKFKKCCLGKAETGSLLSAPPLPPARGR